MIRGLLLIALALFIDGLQALVSLVLAGLIAFGGTIGGAAVGVYACSGAGSIIASLCGAAGGFFGTALNSVTATVGEPFGIAVGFIVSICISATFGTFLVWLMALSGMFYPGRVIAAYTGEMLPGFSLLPAWTVLVVSSVIKKTQEEKAGFVGTLATIAASSLVPGGAIGAAVREGSLRGMGDASTAVPRSLQQQEEVDARQESTGRTPLVNASRVDGIRPAQKIASAAAALLLIFGFNSVAHAQSLGNQPDPVQFSIAPETPGPRQRVVIEAQGIGTFLGDATITWQVDGKTVQSGVGARTLSFIAGELGAQTRVHVVVQSSSQGTIVRDFNFLPSAVNLIWEADTSVPPFYRGKALYSAGSPLTVTAFPQVVSGGISASPSSLSYQWTRSGSPVPAQSGKGRNSFSFIGDQLKNSEVVGVDAYVGDNKVAHGEITIPASEPTVFFYNRDPLRGVLYDAALPSTISLNAKEITIKAEPYFFSNRSLQNGSLSYSWTLNGQNTTGPDAQRGIMILRQTASGAGSASLGVSIQNTDTNAFVQSAQALLQIVFGVPQSSGSSLFGI